MPTELHDHKTGTPLNDALRVARLDELDPKNGNMAHDYVIVWDSVAVPAVPGFPEVRGQDVTLHFQRGPIKEVGVNGISNEALIAIVLDRLRGAQGGDFRCRENACAITHFEEGVHWLTARTMDRTRRGVEGQNKP